jgi:hypothetical protein
MHRFVWDLHYPPPDALQHGYPISAIPGDTPRYPLGVIALPGTYTIKLTVHGRSYTQPLTIKMDPRVTTPRAGLTQQFALATRVVAAMHRDYEALQQVRALRAQLAVRRSSAGERAVASRITALDEKAAAIAGGGSAPRANGSTAQHNLTQLNGELSQLLDIVDGADATPTTQATAAVAELERALAADLAQWNTLRIRDVTALNDQLRKAKLEPIEVDEK